MTELLPFFIVLLAGLFFSEVFKRFHLPWVSALIIGGMIIGPFGLSWFSPSDTTIFLGDIGLIFLMFLAGLETRLSSFAKHHKEISAIVVFNSAIPFAVGFFVSYLFFGDVLLSVLLGIVFIASSIAVIVPSLKSCKLLGTRFGETTIGSTIIMDVLSLILLSVLLHETKIDVSLPLPVFYALAFAMIVFLRWAVVKLWRAADKHVPDSKDLFQEELRILFAILIGTVILFEVIGLHPIVAGFFAGFVLSESIRSTLLLEKVRALGYGLFVPIFFIVLGAQTDLGAIGNVDGSPLLIGVIVLSAMAAKFVSGLFAGRMIGFSRSQRLLLGVATMPHLTTTLAAVLVGQELGIFPEEIVTAIVVLIIITSFVSPFLIRLVSKTRHHKKIAQA